MGGFKKNARCERVPSDQSLTFKLNCYSYATLMSWKWGHPSKRALFHCVNQRKKIRKIIKKRCVVCVDKKKSGKRF